MINENETKRRNEAQIKVKHRFSSIEFVVKQRRKNVISLENINHRTDPFTYPLFYPAETSGCTVRVPIRISYRSCSHLTLLELRYIVSLLNWKRQYLPYPLLDRVPLNAYIQSSVTMHAK